MDREQAYKILIVDDAKDIQLLLDFDLTSAGYQVDCCDSGEQALLILADRQVDLVLLDMYMAGLSGLETLSAVKSDSNTNAVPVIMLSASSDVDEIVTALELGAEDYVVKPYTAKILLARIRTAIRLKEKTQQLEYLAKTDFLTNINNRGNFFELSGNALNLANRSEQPLTVAMFDIDFFKQVNDDYGHDMGDKVLVSFAQQLIQTFRDYDILGRIGGEEFAVCLPNTCINSAQTACERFRQEIEATSFPVINDIEKSNQHNFKITVSIGLSSASIELTSIDELLKQADKALYYAKDHGRNKVVNINEISEQTMSESADNTSECNINQNQNQVEQNNMNIENSNNRVTLKDPLSGIDFLVGVNNVLGDEDLFHEILIMFYQDHHLDGNKLSEAIQNKDTESAKHIAHTLKGVASSVGAMMLFEKTKAFDIAINENRVDEYQKLLSALLPELTNVMQNIKANLDVS